mmetsp:Transcript_3869/g.9027  ORF Transcript_3869/g.9027 Transcript_3869/m.9027 type:complete len:259 (+) Transcript_3869:51-827(+)
MDRFYQLGLPQEADAWKTCYEVANEMRSYERSSFPPGCAVHQPGAREKFGHSSPGPTATRLSKPELCLTEDTDHPNPRMHHAVPRVQVPDDRETFLHYDIPEMQRSYKTPVAAMSLSPDARAAAKASLSRSRSLPGISRSFFKKLSKPIEPIEKHEDQYFTYFVPQALRNEGPERLASSTLSKLQKVDRVTMSMTGDGTGFRTQGGHCSWWPSGSYRWDQPTTYRDHFWKPPLHRLSPLETQHAVLTGHMGRPGGRPS